MVHAILDYSTHETVTRASGLHMALRLFGKSNKMMEYYCCGGVLQYAPGNLTPIELLHVHRVREGEHVAKASPSPASHHAHGRGREGIVIKLLLVVRVDATHQSRALDIFQ